MGERRNAYKTLMVKLPGKHPWRWENNIKTDLTETGSEDHR
jgi:hypothetical protein